MRATTISTSTSTLAVPYTCRCAFCGATIHHEAVVVSAGYAFKGGYANAAQGQAMKLASGFQASANLPFELEYAEKRLEHYRDNVASGKLKKYLETGKSDKADTFRVEAGSPLENYLKSKANKTQGQVDQDRARLTAFPYRWREFVKETRVKCPQCGKTQPWCESLSTERAGWISILLGCGICLLGMVPFIAGFTPQGSQIALAFLPIVLSSFFSWLEDEDYIVKSPVRRIHKVKTGKTVKETYSDESLELMRDHCDNARDLAMIDLLASTGIRVGELVKLNRSDIDFDNRECVVFGKGNKERKVYFDARTKIHLQRYLDERTDDNEALFVSLLNPFDRLQISGVEIRLRKIGKELNFQKVHPHKFRRTLATMAIDKGMPIEQVQQLLGHQSIDTTLQYAMVNQNNVKESHRKFIG